MGEIQPIIPVSPSALESLNLQRILQCWRKESTGATEGAAKAMMSEPSRAGQHGEVSVVTPQLFFWGDGIGVLRFWGRPNRPRLVTHFGGCSAGDSGV